MSLHTPARKAGAAAAAVAAVATSLLAPVGGSSGSLAVMNNCGLNGSETSGSPHAIENNFKNRFTLPAASDIDPSVSFQKLMASAKADDPDIDQNRAATIEGYIVEVKPGGVESCNCHTSDPVFMDTHIYVSDKPGASQTDKKHQLIVEVTPRIRALIKAKTGDDWSTAALQKKYEGKHVRVSGWLFYDGEHERNSLNIFQIKNGPTAQPTGTSIWRYTCWEVHPVTGFEILADGGGH